MWPYFVGNLKTYIVFYVLGMVVHFLAGWTLCRRMGIRVRVAAALTGCYVFGMAVGARILYDLLHHKLDWHNYLKLGYYFGDGIWGGPLAYLAVAVGGVVLFGSDKKKLLDLTVLSLVLPMILAKVACFYNGCCYGFESNLPWAMTFPPGAEAPSGIARHPTQVYEIVVLLVIVLVFRLLDRDRWRGTLLFWFVAIYGIGRPVTEVFRAAEKREPFLAGLSASQFVCGMAAAVSILILLVYSRGRVREWIPAQADGVREGILPPVVLAPAEKGEI